MVVGDRLWLFSQSPSGPTPVQTLLLNNGPIMPPLPHNNLRSLHPSSQPIPPNGMIVRNPQLPGEYYSPGISSSGFANKSFATFHSNMTDRGGYLKPYDGGPLVPIPRSITGGPEMSPQYFMSKYSPHSMDTGGAVQQPPTGIADLEKAFGNPSELLMPLMTKNGSDQKASGESQGSDENVVGLRDGSDSSEIDCEEIDEDGC